ncbi:MAG TPA: zinc ribbon domain-containing protein [Thermoanaerobacterales bacterium]|jgi:putative FmdB family regulatory protein|nr:zinc ribbon domain-containing protein [Thermoanaerobacterales bacterium]
MPIYEFKCTDCNHKFEELINFSEKDKKVHCPKCKSHNIKKAFSVFGTSVARGDSSSCPSAPSCGGTGFG